MVREAILKFQSPSIRLWSIRAAGDKSEKYSSQSFNKSSRGREGVKELGCQSGTFTIIGLRPRGSETKRFPLHTLGALTFKVVNCWQLFNKRRSKFYSSVFLKLLEPIDTLMKFGALDLSSCLDLDIFGVGGWSASPTQFCLATFVLS